MKYLRLRVCVLINSRNVTLLELQAKFLNLDVILILITKTQTVATVLYNSQHNIEAISNITVLVVLYNVACNMCIMQVATCR